jgi:hypothetical protein
MPPMLTMFNDCHYPRPFNILNASAKASNAFAGKITV